MGDPDTEESRVYICYRAVVYTNQTTPVKGSANQFLLFTESVRTCPMQDQYVLVPCRWCRGTVSGVFIFVALN